MTASSTLAGPVLLLDAFDEGRARLCALFVAPRATPPAPVIAEGRRIEPEAIAECGQDALWRVRFDLPAQAGSHYDWNGDRFDLQLDLSGDLTIGFVSCNGQETGDLDRPESERNAMWTRLARTHSETPLSLLLHGGDQIYADEVTRGHPLSDRWPDHVPEAPSPEALNDLRAHLWRGFFTRYARLYAGEGFRWLAARVPSLAQWDDHDICDGWGSLMPEATQSAVGQCLFDVAREATLLFQHGARPGDLPARFSDPQARHLGWHVAAPGLTILAPDLRGERTRHRIMGPDGWAAMETMTRGAEGGRTLLMSSVPLLGPRLSLLERVMNLIPRMQHYEDDLRDQWQSRAHREEWRRMLRLMIEKARQPGSDVTAISGEIHLATRAYMTDGDGRSIHQLVASGITHPPPPAAWARALGSLAIFGEDPLPDHPIRIRPLPGQRHRYINERNFLLLTRASGDWTASWELEESGRTPALPL